MLMINLMLVRAEEDMGHMVDINSTTTDGYLRSDSSEGSSFVLLSAGKVDTISSAKKRRQRGGVWCKITAKKTEQGFVGGSRDWAIGLGVLRQNSLSLSLTLFLTHTLSRASVTSTGS